MVLLENNGILPLNTDRKVAYIGEFAEKPRYQGGGSSHINPFRVVSALDAAGEKGRSVTYAKGFSMENDVFKTNPVFQNLSPEKLSFLMNFANSKKPTEMKDMMPFLLGTLSSAKKQNIQFTKPETELMISILKQSMSPEEAEKADKIIRLMKERSGQSQ